MSIYATLWSLKFPTHGDAFQGCDWVTVHAQGVPAHIGTPTRGHGYEERDPYAEFLPPAVELDENNDGGQQLRAVVFVVEGARKGTERSGQEYVAPLLVLGGSEYGKITFEALHRRLCDALRGNRPRLAAEIHEPGGSVKVLFEDGSSVTVPPRVRRLRGPK